MNGVGSIGTRVRSAIACEQALLLGRASGEAARSRGKDPSLARSPEAHPNRRACWQTRSANAADSPCSMPLGLLRETSVAADQRIIFVLACSAGVFWVGETLSVFVLF